MPCIIDYWTTKGTPSARPIYGVRPPEQVIDGMPPDVQSLAWPEDRTAVTWPVPSLGRGGERTSAVDTTVTPMRLVVLPDAPPPVADGAAFHPALPGLFDGATPTEKMSRGITVLKTVNTSQGAIATDFRAACDAAPLSRNRQTYLRTLWAQIKVAPGGLSAAEITAIEAAAVSNGFSLT